MAEPTAKPLSFVRRLSLIGTRFALLWAGRQVGRDALGNRYYQLRGAAKGRRWVFYNGDNGPETIPPAWWLWLHQVTNDPAPLKVEAFAAPLPKRAVSGFGKIRNYQPWKDEEAI